MKSPRSAAARLDRLRLLLTVLFTVMNAIGLVVFAWLAIVRDDERGHERLDGDLERVTAVVDRLLQYDNGTVVTGFIGRDEVNDECPQFAVLPGGPANFAGYYSARSCVGLDKAVLGGLAAEAVNSGNVVYGDVGSARVRAEPVRGNDTGQYIGAVVAATDAGPTYAGHDRFVLWVAGGCVLLTAALAAAGHFLASRAIRPAAAALAQQEILLAETAHDLRSPVASLRALAETAVRHPEQNAELMPRTVDLAGQMGDIIDSLLVRARLAAGVEALAAQPVWLEQLVGVLVDDLPDTGATVTLNAAPTLVQVDPSLVRRAVSNLLDNALRHGKQPGQAAVVHVTVAGGRVTIADQGPGVDPDLAGNVLDRFTTTGSSGLGLSIVRWVAQAHGGRLEVFNSEDGGAIFELTLPPAPQPR